MRFEWDDEKNRINQRKHDGQAFETAALVFTIPLQFFEKIAYADGEQRWHAIGSALSAVLLIVSCLWQGGSK